MPEQLQQVGLAPREVVRLTTEAQMLAARERDRQDFLMRVYNESRAPSPSPANADKRRERDTKGANVKAITMYEANDGSRWNDADKALEREALIGRVQWAVLPLGDLPKLPGCDFENGGGFKRHKPKDVAECKRRLIELTRPLLADWFKTQTQMGRSDFMDTHPTWFLRLLDGSAPPLEQAWRRICCIDSEGREWGQPYYASHPNEAKQVELV